MKRLRKRRKRAISISAAAVLLTRAGKLTWQLVGAPTAPLFTSPETDLPNTSYPYLIPLPLTLTPTSYPLPLTLTSYPKGLALLALSALTSMEVERPALAPGMHTVG